MSVNTGDVMYRTYRLCKKNQYEKCIFLLNVVICLTSMF